MSSFTLPPRKQSVEPTHDRVTVADRRFGTPHPERHRSGDAPALFGPRLTFLVSGSTWIAVPAPAPMVPIAMVGRFNLNRPEDRKSTRLNSSHVKISSAIF